MIYRAKIISGKILPSDHKRFIADLRQYEGKEVSISIDKWTKIRSTRQNNSLHLYFSLLATELNLAGWDIKKVLDKEVDISWSGIAVKELIFKPLMKVHLGKKSTTQLTTEDINIIYDQVNRIISERCGVSVPFPNVEAIFRE